LAIVILFLCNNFLFLLIIGLNVQIIVLALKVHLIYITVQVPKFFNDTAVENVCTYMMKRTYEKLVQHRDKHRKLAQMIQNKV